MSAGAGTRLAVAWLPFAVTLVLARGRRVHQWEHAATRRLNQLPEALHYPLWVVMQTGTAGAPVVAGGVAVAGGRPALAGRLTTSGIVSYLLAKGVKRVVQAHVPLRNMFGYSTRLRSLTEGRATFSMERHSYDTLQSA